METQEEEPRVCIVCVGGWAGHLLVLLGVVTAEKKDGRQGVHNAAVREEEELLLDQTNQRRDLDAELLLMEKLFTLAHSISYLRSVRH